ncbi:MAG: head GIN domain-containing protein [Muribaculaceae bacterium]
MIKKTALAMMLVLASTFTLLAENVTASKKIITKQVDVKNFSEIVTNSIIDVDYYYSDTYNVTITAPDNVIPYIELTKKGNTLQVGLKENVNIRTNGKTRMVVKVKAPKVNVFKVNGSGDISIKSWLKTSELNLGISGSGDITAEHLNVDDFTIGISGSGDFTSRRIESKNSILAVSGSGDIKINNLITNDVKCGITGSGDISFGHSKTNTATLSSSGSGDIKAKYLFAQDVIANSTGAGDVSCNVSETLSAVSTGSGDITYYGEPLSVKSNRKNLKKGK